MKKNIIMLCLYKEIIYTVICIISYYICIRKNQRIFFFRTTKVEWTKWPIWKWIFFQYFKRLVIVSNYILTFTRPYNKKFKILIWLQNCSYSLMKISSVRAREIRIVGPGQMVTAAHIIFLYTPHTYNLIVSRPAKWTNT